jgi:hypothetical protein
LAAANSLSVIRRLTVPLHSGTDAGERLTEARHFAALSLSLIERAQEDLAFCRVERRILESVR